MPTTAEPAQENGAPRSKLQELQLKSGQVTDEVSTYLLYILMNYILILSDSQAALEVLESSDIKSKLAWDCSESLRTLANK